MTVRRIVLGGEETTLRSWGAEGPAVVFAHSAGLDSRSAEALGEALARRRYRTFAIDLRGHGGSSAAARDVTLHEIARDLTELPDVLGEEHPHLIGTSLGGVVASLACDMGGSAYGDVSIVCSPPRGFPAFADRARQAEENGMSALVGDTIDRWFTAEQVASEADAVVLARESVSAMDVDCWASLWRDFAEFDGHPDLSDVLPVLCIAGAADRSTPIEAMSLVSEAVRGPLQILEGAPHQALMTHAGDFVEVWTRWLEDRQPATPPFR